MNRIMLGARDGLRRRSLRRTGAVALVLGSFGTERVRRGRRLGRWIR
jgi:hypothetical protein